MSEDISYEGIYEGIYKYHIITYSMKVRTSFVPYLLRIIINPYYLRTKVSLNIMYERRYVLAGLCMDMIKKQLVPFE